MNLKHPLPENELDRLLTLSEFDLDYNNLQNNFKDLTRLAAKVAGTEISLVNLIDSFTQWTISNHGLLIEQMPREESVCQYTIMGDNQFEVKNLGDDDRFMNRFYVTGKEELRYYFGVPLKTDDGFNIGALCVMDKIPKELDPEKVELLKIIADEIVNRLNYLKVIEGLKSKVKEARETKLKVVHDIRGPLNGIIGLAKLVSEQGEKNNLDDVLQFIGMIQKSSTSILELADEILGSEKRLQGDRPPKSNELNLLTFKDKLEKLYGPQATSKNIQLNISTTGTQGIPFLKSKLLQITGNLVSNAIKFTPPEGKVDVSLNLTVEEEETVLKIQVDDSGIGLSAEAIDDILNSSSNSTSGTGGEKGYGFGLSLVKHLVAGLSGTFNIISEPGKGSTFVVRLPKMKL